MNNEQSIIERLTVQFDAQWKSGQRPNIADLLNQTDQSQHSKLLRLVLPIDFEYRQGAGETVEPMDYQPIGIAAMEITKEILAAEAYTTILPQQNIDQTLAPTQLNAADGQDDDQDVDPYATTSSLPEPETIKSMMIGPYKLLQVLGEGGMGVVWMAEQEKPVRRRGIEADKTGHRQQTDHRAIRG